MTDWDAVRTSRVTVPDHVVFRALAQETVLLNIQTSTYHVVDEVGARFFEVVQASPTLDAACDTLAAEYEQPRERIAGDLTTFCRELSELGLIDVRRDGA